VAIREPADAGTQHRGVPALCRLGVDSHELAGPGIADPDSPGADGERAGVRPRHIHGHAACPALLIDRDHQQLPPEGEYRLVIAKGAGQDVLKATDPGGFTVAMDMRAAGEIVDLTSYVDPSKASFCGPEVPAPAQYAFKAESSVLSLEPSEDDPCADRDSILTGTWRTG
jgi:hypothetical protein